VAWRHKSFWGAAYIGCGTLDDPELFPSLVKYKSALQDAECARFARLKVMIPDLENKLAAKQAERQDIAELQVKTVRVEVSEGQFGECSSCFVHSLHSLLQTARHCRLSTNCRTELTNSSFNSLKLR